MGFSPGEESLTAAVAVQAIEAQPAFGQIEPMRGEVLACAEQHLGDVPAIDWPTQEAPAFPAKEKKACRAERRPLVAEEAEADADARHHWGCCLPKRWPGSIEVCRQSRYHCHGDGQISQLVPTCRRWTRGLTRRGHCPQSVTGPGPEQRPLPERAQPGSTRAPRRCIR